MTPKDMMVAEVNAEAMGIPLLSLMENAGRGLAQNIMKISEPCQVTIFAGKGGNGGDGFVAARYLLNQGYEVKIILLTHPDLIGSDESKINWKVLENINNSLNTLHISINNYYSPIHQIDSAVVVDALFGTGIKGKIREPYSRAIDVINQSKSVTVAVDLPSGIDPLTGKVLDKAVRADLTVTFHKPKSGLLKAEKELVGNIQVCDIGIPAEAEKFTGPGDLLRLINRDINSHKGQNGRVLIVGGSNEFSGAPALAALSSLRSGADLAVVASPHIVAKVIRSYSPDLIVKDLSNDYLSPMDVEKVLELSNNADSVVIGCGLGREEETEKAVNQLIEKIKKPMVIDADALKIIDEKIIREKKHGAVLTPHAREFKLFSGHKVPKNLLEKVDLVSNVSTRFKSTILLKGVIDVIAEGKGVRLNSTGNPGMTVGGTGDCLAGIVASLISQGHSEFEASFIAAYVNGSAGDLAKKRYGYNFLASDLLEFIPEVLRDPNKVQ